MDRSNFCIYSFNGVSFLFGETSFLGWLNKSKTMINFIITQYNLFSTGRIKRELEKLGIPGKISYSPNPRAINVNYSIRTPIEEGVKILNPGQLIELANNKKKVRFDLRRLFPEITPKVYIPGRHFCKFPLVLRPDYHRQGKDFYIARSYKEMFELIEKHPQLTHGIELIYPNIEFAVWVFKEADGSIKSYKLQWKDPGEIDDILPKNFSLGNSIFKWAKGFKYKSEVREAAKKALDYSGLDFARIDILWSEEKKQPFILEINPRFSIVSNSTEKIFVKFLKKYYKDFYGG